MSGEKRTPIQILRDDLNSARNQLYSIKRQREQLANDLKSIKRDNRRQIKNLENQMQQREQRFQSTVANLEGEMQEITRRHYEGLQQQRREFLAAQEEQRQSLIAEIEASEQRTDSKINHLAEWTSQQLDEQRKSFNQQLKNQQRRIKAIQADVQNLYDREQNRVDRAKAYLQNLEQLVAASKENFNHSKFAPGKLMQVERQMAAAQDNINADNASAAMPLLQQAHFQLMDIETEVQNASERFERIYSLSLENANALLNNVRKNRTLEMEEGDSSSKQEVDYWTDGRFSALEQKVEEQLEQLKNQKEELNFEDCEKVLDQLGQFANEQEQLINEAVERIVSSQVRAEMGDVVVNVLEDQGFSLSRDEVGYTENDQRKSYLVKLENRSGTKVVTVISPSEETYENIISINTYDGFHDEAAEQLRNREIRQALADSGLNPAETQCLPESVFEFKDVSSILKADGAGIPKKALEKTGMLNSQTTAQSSKAKQS